MLTLIIAMIASTLILGTSFWATPVLEWTTVLLHMNYFTLMNISNPFFDSIHPYYESKSILDLPLLLRRK